MKRGISLFLIYLVSSLTLNSNIVVSLVNNPALRERTILDQCNVDAKSGSDTIKVVLKAAQPNKVIISLYPGRSEGGIHQTKIIAKTEISNDNLYRFTYQNKEYTTKEPKNLDEIVYSDGTKICYIDETDKSRGRASTQTREICGEFQNWVWTPANFVNSPIVINYENGERIAYACQYNFDSTEVNNYPPSEGFKYYLPINDIDNPNCPPQNCYEYTKLEVTPETEEPLPPPIPEIQEPIKCEEITDPTACDNLNCEWIGSRQIIPPECSNEGIVGGLYSAFRFFTNLFANILGFFLKTQV